MKNKLEKLLKEYVEQATETDVKALLHVLKGMKNKLEGHSSTYIGGILHYEKNPEETVWEVNIPINPVLFNSLGIVHGGITATLVDSAMGTLANNLVPEGYGAVTSQLNVHYLAPGIGDGLRCRAEVAHQGKNTMVISAEVFRTDGKKAAQATGSFFIVEKKVSSGE
ncbi:PaaI family thioesterase [Neobacillus notoginsengisoli]|uniref:PaaI family thioesterase n=1 Tax=Neobacillus notoginsengisoli TaxID=1578198 RepID=A0A417YRC9_9BACI|nr:PaaI family thioesterase [Neobacillus notoginsengisoli]RHW36528.1 PaaI family thioesterase [Neobacillus notoginsengisoli]